MGFLSRCCGRKGPHLVWRRISLGFSRVVVGFLSSYDRDLRDPLLGLRNVHSPCKSQGSRWDFSAVAVVPRSSSGVETGTLGFLSRADMDLGVPLWCAQWNQASSCVEPCKSLSSRAGKACQTSCRVDHRDLWLSLEGPQGCHNFHRVLSQSSV